MPGTAAGLDKRKAQRLKRGRLPIEDRLDLHGLTQAQAHRALRGFVLRCHGDGKRCVLIITGKGVIRETQGEKHAGVLRGMLPHWLNEGPLRPCVLALQEAQPRDGGSGAFYLLLRRQR